MLDFLFRLTNRFYFYLAHDPLEKQRVAKPGVGSYSPGRLGTEGRNAGGFT